MKLRVIKAHTQLGMPYKPGDLVEYHPWFYEWQGMDEGERIRQGIFINCYGHGEFEVFTPELVSLDSPLVRLFVDHQAVIQEFVRVSSMPAKSTRTAPDAF